MPTTKTTTRSINTVAEPWSYLWLQSSAVGLLPSLQWPDIHFLALKCLSQLRKFGLHFLYVPYHLRYLAVQLWIPSTNTPVKAKHTERTCEKSSCKHGMLTNRYLHWQIRQTNGLKITTVAKTTHTLHNLELGRKDIIYLSLQLLFLSLRALHPFFQFHYLTLDLKTRSAWVVVASS